MTDIFDSIIIGAGPAGLSAAINFAQRGKACVVLSSGESLLRRGEQIDNYLGMPAMSGAEMMDKFTAHAVSLGCDIRKGIVSNIYPTGGSFMVNFGGDILTAKTILIACGIAKAKTVEGEENLLGKGVSYCATCDGMLYRNKNVVVWGLSKEASHEANFLAGIGCKVTFISANMPEDLANGIEYIKGKISKILGDEQVKSVIVGDTELEAQGVFVLRAAIAPATLLAGLDILDGYVKINSKCETNIKGVYAAGDVTGKPLQVSNAVGDGLIAAQNAVELLDEGVK